MNIDAQTPDSKFERETIINTSDGDQLVRIETWQRRYLGKLRRDPRFTETSNPDNPAHDIFTIPADKWTPTSGAKRRVMLTPERKTELAQRLKTMNPRQEGQHHAE